MLHRPPEKIDFFIFDVNYFINFLKKICFKNGLKTCRLYILYRYCKAVLLEYFSTSFIMDFLALHDDEKFIISKHLASDLKVRTFLSKNHDLQKILFGDIMYNDDLCKYLNLMYDAKENDDFKNAKIFKIY